MREVDCSTFFLNMVQVRIGFGLDYLFKYKALWYVECCWTWLFLHISKHFDMWSVVEFDLTSPHQSTLVYGVLLNLTLPPYIKTFWYVECCWIWSFLLTSKCLNVRNIVESEVPLYIWYGKTSEKLILSHIKVLWYGKYSDEKPKQIPINFHISKCFAMENVLNMKVHMVYIKVFIFFKKIQPGFYFNLNCIYYIRTFWCGKYFNKKSNMNSKIIFKKMHNNTLDLYLLYANDIFLAQIDLIKSTCSLAPAPFPFLRW